MFLLYDQRSAVALLEAQGVAYYHSYFDSSSREEIFLACCDDSSIVLRSFLMQRCQVIAYASR